MPSINGLLVGGDWNHGILNDFPIFFGNVIIPTDELTPSFFRGIGQPPTRLLLTIINHMITIYKPLLRVY